MKSRKAEKKPYAVSKVVSIDEEYRTRKYFKY